MWSGSRVVGSLEQGKRLVKVNFCGAEQTDGQTRHPPLSGRISPTSRTAQAKVRCRSNKWRAFNPVQIIVIGERTETLPSHLEISMGAMRGNLSKEGTKKDSSISRLHSSSYPANDITRSRRSAADCPRGQEATGARRLDRSKRVLSNFLGRRKRVEVSWICLCR